MTPLRCFGLLVVGTSLFACGKNGTCGGKELLLEISGNHGHDTRVPADRLENFPQKLRLEGGTHDHVLRVAEPDLEKLKKGESVTVRSSSMNAHVHEIQYRCAK